MSFHIAIDIGGTQLRAACYSSDRLSPITLRRIFTKDSQSTPLERLKNLIQSVWPENQTVSAIGLAAPGPVDIQRGVILNAPNIPGWENLPLCQLLEERFDTPAVIGNDANMAALGEWKYGAGRGHHDLLYMTISTGIGGGIIVDDRLLLGARGLAAEIGHVTIIPDGPLCNCGQRGHLEAIAAGPAIARWVEDRLSSGAVSSLLNEQPVTAKAVSQAAKQGDELARQALETAGNFIGLAMTNFVHIFNPTAIIIGGGVSLSGDLILEPISKSLKKYVMNPQYLDNLVINSAAFGDEAGLLGALTLARNFRPE